jgi:hypothetical protein
MEAMTKGWTDERLEERFDRIEQRFDHVDADLREIRRELTARFDTTQRLIIQVGGGMLVTMILGFLGVITQV